VALPSQRTRLQPRACAACLLHAATASGINVPLLTSIARGSGGELVALPGGFLSGPALARQLSAALSRRFGLEGALDCYCSEGLRLLQWMGPLDAFTVLGAKRAGSGGSPCHA
jgi:hypothetical protein